MPKMGGIDLASRLRSETWARALEVIALTGMGQKSDIDATAAAGFRAHLVKPARTEDIVRLASGEAANNVVPIRQDLDGIFAKSPNGQ